MRMKVVAVISEKVILKSDAGRDAEYALDAFNFQPRTGDWVEVIEDADEISIRKIEAEEAPPQPASAPQPAPAAAPPVHEPAPQTPKVAVALPQATPASQATLVPGAPLQASHAAAPVGFARAVVRSLFKYAGFSGRASRSEFWYFQLFVWLLFFAAAFVPLPQQMQQALPLPQRQLALCVLAALLLPVLASGARRLHDRGMSGWWQVLSVIPVLGLLTVAGALVSGERHALLTGAILFAAGLPILLILFALRGKAARNRFDPPAT